MSVITSGLTITSTYGSWYFGELPIRADQKSVDQFCIEKGYISGSTFTADGGRFSNDGGREMNYYDSILVPIRPSGTTTEYHWFNLFGYDGIVTSITEP
jgi:hypothetical protein